jgi:hypothetical protein
MDISIFGYKINLEIIILICVIYLILVGHTVCSCCNYNNIMEGLTTMKKNIKKISNKKEGFTPANTNYGESSRYNLDNENSINTSSWHLQDLTVVPGEPLSKGVKEILDRPSQPVPLPEGQLLMFANTPFKPECCPNTYSNSMGCACMTTKQYNYLVTRGGNNVPYSEY